MSVDLSNITVSDAIRAAEEEARRQEREECAKVAERVYVLEFWPAWQRIELLRKSIAEAIRKRGGPT